MTCIINKSNNGGCVSLNCNEDEYAGTQDPKMLDWNFTALALWLRCRHDTLDKE